MWYIGETIISKINNFKNVLSKIPFYEKMFFWQKDYSPLKQSKQIGSLTHDCTLIY